MIAARKRSSPQTLDLLIKAGSDVLAKDKKGETALDKVKSHPQADMRESVIQFLEQEEDKQNELYSHYRAKH